LRGVAKGDKHGSDRDAGEQERTLDERPADRPEQPLGEEEGEPDRGEQGGEDESGDGNAGEGGDPLDLVDDLRELGPGELDVGRDDPLQGRPDGADLLAQTRGMLAVNRPVGRRAVASVARRPVGVRGL